MQARPGGPRTAKKKGLIERLESRLAALAAGAPAEAAAEETEWPDESAEASFLSEAAARGGAPAHPSDGNAALVIGDKLPPLDELVKKVPAGVLGLLDDLFRAKFTGVRKFAVPAPEAATLTGAAKGPPS